MDFLAFCVAQFSVSQLLQAKGLLPNCLPARSEFSESARRGSITTKYFVLGLQYSKSKRGSVV